MGYRDRRQSPAHEDQTRTGKLINDAMGYLGTDKPDTRFADVILTGCIEGKGSDYPPAGHDYPRRDR